MGRKIKLGILGVVASICAISVIYLIILEIGNKTYHDNLSDITTLTLSDFRTVKSTLVNDSSIEGLKEFCDSNGITVNDWHSWYTTKNHDPVVAYQYIDSLDYDILMICGKTAWLIKINEEMYETDDGQVEYNSSWIYSDPVDFR